jgi:hypothetical protein
MDRNVAARLSRHDREIETIGLIRALERGGNGRGPSSH